LAHTNLGNALRDQGKVSEAIAAYREAIRLKPDFALAHTNLGNALRDQGKVSEAMAAHREAIRLKPDFAEAHYNLGFALRDQGKVSEAIAAYREAIRLKPDYALAHANLGVALHREGKYEEALAELRAARERAGPEPEKRLPGLGQMIAKADRTAALAARLPALLEGEDRPKDVAERLALAQMCYDTRRFSAAVRFWAEALAAEPKLGDDRQAGHRYNAACAAALAAAGQGTDDPKPDDAARARLRGQALDWLKAERAVWAKVLDAVDAQARSVVRQTLQHWQADSDLAGVRDRDTLAKLPADERRAWEALWKEVDALLKGAARPGPTSSKPGVAAPVRQGAAPAGSRPTAPPQGPPPPATPNPDVNPGMLEALASLHKRTLELAHSKPAEAEPLFRQALEAYREAEGPEGALTVELRSKRSSGVSRDGWVGTPPRAMAPARGPESDLAHHAAATIMKTS
jgi:tetratricopeptide (TPR) repeat protein